MWARESPLAEKHGPTPAPPPPGKRKEWRKPGPGPAEPPTPRKPQPRSGRRKIATIARTWDQPKVISLPLDRRIPSRWNPAEVPSRPRRQREDDFMPGDHQETQGIQSRVSRHPAVLVGTRGGKYIPEGRTAPGRHLQPDLIQSPSNVQRAEVLPVRGGEQLLQPVIAGREFRAINRRVTTGDQPGPCLTGGTVVPATAFIDEGAAGQSGPVCFPGRPGPWEAPLGKPGNETAR